MTAVTRKCLRWTTPLLGLITPLHSEPHRPCRRIHSMLGLNASTPLTFSQKNQLFPLGQLSRRTIPMLRFRKIVRTAAVERVQLLRIT